jgi:hypothetical protein
VGVDGGCDRWDFEVGVGLGKEGGGRAGKGGEGGKGGVREEGKSEAQHEWAGSG